LPCTGFCKLKRERGITTLRARIVKGDLGADRQHPPDDRQDETTLLLDVLAGVAQCLAGDVEVVAYDISLDRPCALRASERFRPGRIAARVLVHRKAAAIAVRDPVEVKRHTSEGGRPQPAQPALAGERRRSVQCHADQIAHAGTID
jgi:hypothetical protein